LSDFAFCIGLRADVFLMVPQHPMETFPRPAFQKGEFQPKVQSIERMPIVEHNFYFSTRAHNTHEFADGFFRIGSVMQDSIGIPQVKAVRFEREIFRISDLNESGFWQTINLNPIREIGQRFFSQINAVCNRSRAQPLNKIRSRAKSDLQHPFTMIAGELRKRMDERLGRIPLSFNFLKILTGKFLRARMVCFTRPAVPNIVGGGIVGLATAYRLLETKAGPETFAAGKGTQARRAPDGQQQRRAALRPLLQTRLGKGKVERQGLQQMVAFCREHGVAHEQCGKIVVATSKGIAATGKSLGARQRQRPAGFAQAESRANQGNRAARRRHRRDSCAAGRHRGLSGRLRKTRRTHPQSRRRNQSSTRGS
jgi:hypothetical protein